PLYHARVSHKLQRDVPARGFSLTNRGLRYDPSRTTAPGLNPPALPPSSSLPRSISMRLRHARSLLVVFLFAAAPLTGWAQDDFSPRPFDWPQWQGPSRNAISKEKGLMQDWPKGGPSLRWKIDGLGAGYSTPGIAAGRILTMGNIGKSEYV